MALEVSQEHVVVGREVAYGIILFRGGVDYRSRVMCEAGKVGAVFLR